MSLLNFRGIVPARFLALIAHFTMLVILSLQREDNIDACLPFDYTEADFEAKVSELRRLIFFSILLLSLEFAGFLSGTSLFHPSAAIISTGVHLSGAVGLSFFFFDQWDCVLFRWVFQWCSTLPAVVEMFSIISVIYSFLK